MRRYQSSARRAQVSVLTIREASSPHRLVSAMRTDRSDGLVLLVYFMAKFKITTDAGQNRPPKEFGRVTWRSAFRMFYERLGDGRSFEKFIATCGPLRGDVRRYLKKGQEASKFAQILSPWQSSSQSKVWRELQQYRTTYSEFEWPFVTYENYANKHVGIHVRGCKHIGKRGGHHKYRQGDYREHDSYLAAERYAEGTTLPIKPCSHCRPSSSHSPTKSNRSEKQKGLHSSVTGWQNRQARGQGFLLNTKLRRKLEKYAVKKAIEHYRALGYRCKPVGKPYDIRCRKGSEQLYVEVKGTRTKGEGIVLTRREVSFARTHSDQMDLFMIHSIKVSKRSADYVLTGGVQRIIRPWEIDRSRLRIVSYTYDMR